MRSRIDIPASFLLSARRCYTVCMYRLVKPLRHAGRRKHDQQIAKETPIEGDLTLSMCSGSFDLKLARVEDSRQEPILPVLHDARLTTMHGNKMLFWGIERNPQTGAEHVQESSS
jgi:hypothetical protein